MLSHEHKFIFIHVPRVASRTLRSGLPPHIDLAENLKIPHTEDLAGMSISRKRRLGPEIWNSYFRFSFVRNPWSRAVSGWRRMHPGKNREISIERREFKEFARNIPKFLGDRSSEYLEERWHLWPQSNHIVDENGEIAVDFVGRFENLQKDFNYVCERIAFDANTLSHIDDTSKKLRIKRPAYQELYDDESREIIAQEYQRDIDLFGYQFDDESKSAGLKQRLSHLANRFGLFKAVES